jgi:hypothetical protein
MSILWPALTCVAVLGFILCGHQLSGDQPAKQPVIKVTHVRVKPVILIPSDVTDYPYWHGAVLMKHLAWTQSRYREFLKGDTFDIVEGDPLELKSTHTTKEFMTAADDGAEMTVLDLFAHDHVERSTCPFVYAVLIENTGKKIAGGGRPINGYVNTGGGVFIASADTLELRNFQSTLQHELGHTFGLVHVDSYGYSMKDNPSIMSYNLKHHTDGWKPSNTPGELIPEDYRLLAFNRRVFAKFKIDPKLTPAEYKISPKVIMLPPMKLAGQEDYTASGDAEFPK